MNKKILGTAIALTAVCGGLGAYLFTEKCETEYGSYNHLKSKICYNRLTGKVVKEQKFKYVESRGQYEIDEKIYDWHGNLASYALYNRWKKDVTDIKEQHIRGKKGNLKRKIVRNRVFGNVDIEYDDDGKVIAKTFFDIKKDGSRKDEKKYTYEYEKQGENFFAKVYVDGKLAWERTFDKSGRLLTSVNHEEHGTDIKCEYDEKGNLLAEHRDGKVYKEYAYNDKNVIILEREYQNGKLQEETKYDGLRTPSVERIPNTYYDFCQTYGDEIVSGGKVTAYTTYDADGNKTVKEFLYEKGKAVLLTNGKVTEEAFYDDKGDVVLRVRPNYKAEYEYYPNRGLKKLVENGEVAEEYNEQGKPLVKAMPNGLYEYKYNEQGQLVEVKKDGNVVEKYDAAGRKIMEINYRGLQEWEYDAKGRLIRQFVTERDYVADVKYDSKGRKASIIRKFLKGSNDELRNGEYLKASLIKDGEKIKYTYNKDGYIATSGDVVIEQAFTEKDKDGVVWDVVVKGSKKIGKSGQNRYEIDYSSQMERRWYEDEKGVREEILSYDYDGMLKNKTVEYYSSGKNIRYEYDKGRLKHKTEELPQNATKEIEYNPVTGEIISEEVYECKKSKEKEECYKNGKLEKKTLFNQDNNRTLSVLYDIETGAEKTVEKRNYDAKGRLLTVYENGKLIEKNIYDKDGGSVRIEYGNETLSKAVYDKRYPWSAVSYLKCKNGKKTYEEKRELIKSEDSENYSTETEYEYSWYSGKGPACPEK